MRRFIPPIVALAISLLTGIAPVRAAELIMFEQAGCVWCAKWNKEVGPVYPKTDEGAQAPLRRIDIRDRPPDDMQFARDLHFTPTFVLMVDGVESGRIEGYPGEDFFWGLLGRLIDTARTQEAAG